MNHGGPYPASSDSRFTAVGHDAIRRWLRPICFQNFPAELLPTQLRVD
jgi:NADP-dependent aldehyde dehydrogenase